MKQQDELGDLRAGGDMISHGVAALALCEAFGLTQDKEFLVPAQLAVRFCERSQHETGGWGAQPQARDDFHVFGWQLLALRSADGNYLLVADYTRPRMTRYLDAQQIDDGRYYGRHMRGRDPQATAIGLLGRTSLGWQRTDQRWHDGIKYLVELGPARHNAQYNFWVSLAARHGDRETWTLWYDKLRGPSLERQEVQGPDEGSWFDAEDACAPHGRVYQTALNIMCHEVYYRHLSIYCDCWPKPELEHIPGDKLEDLFGEPGEEDPFGG